MWKELARRFSPLSAGPRETIWSIGILLGVSPLDLRESNRFKNPVLTRADVTDVPALFVADPFMIQVDGKWRMFFEVYNKAHRKGEIGCAVSANGIDWKYEGIVLAEPFHLSYPCVVDWAGDFYMIPESRDAGDVRLYRASHFPDRWEYVASLFHAPFADSTVFRFENRWWMFTDASPSYRLRYREPQLGYRHDTLRLFHADQLTGPWREHPKSPIVHSDPHIARPGGRVFMGRTHLRFAQDCYPIYGSRLFAFQITRLSPTCYEEIEIREGPILAPGTASWNRDGMHHIDPHLLDDGNVIACVDGFSWQLDER